MICHLVLLTIITYIPEFLKSFNKFQSRSDFSDLEMGCLKGFLLSKLIEGNNSRLPKSLHLALKNLKSIDSIIISKSDKGNTIVIMDKSDYIRRIDLLLDDRSTHLELNYNPLKKSQTNFNNSLKEILLGQTEKISLFKSFLPRFPSWVAKELSILVGNISGCHLKNSEDFIEKLNGLNFGSNKYVSYDVVSLFTNVPTELTMELLKEYVQEQENVFFGLFRSSKESY